MTTGPRKFSLEPFYAERVMQLVAIAFDVVKGDDIYHPINPVFQTSLPVNEIDYGKLFTYAFRRFGMPNKPWDGYKDIAEWILKTPHPDLFLLLRPAPCKDPHFSIMFSASEEVFLACKKWERVDLDAWIERKLDWVEKQGLPDWMPEYVRQYAEIEFPGATWRDFYRGYLVLFESPRYREPEDESKKAFSEFALRAKEFKKIEPSPDFRERSFDLSQWADDDPLKPLAIAAIEALTDLKTGVRVRDTAINAFGRMKDGEGPVVNEPESAGKTVGLMFNQSPRECIAIQSEGRRLGNGDYKAGLSKILELTGKIGSIEDLADEG